MTNERPWTVSCQALQSFPADCTAGYIRSLLTSWWKTDGYECPQAAPDSLATNFEDVLDCAKLWYAGILREIDMKDPDGRLFRFGLHHLMGFPSPKWVALNDTLADCYGRQRGRPCYYGFMTDDSMQAAEAILKTLLISPMAGAFLVIEVEATLGLRLAEGVDCMEFLLEACRLRDDPKATCGQSIGDVIQRLHPDWFCLGQKQVAVLPKSLSRMEETAIMWRMRDQGHTLPEIEQAVFGYVNTNSPGNRVRGRLDRAGYPKEAKQTAR